jgi:AFG3 family protein
MQNRGPSLLPRLQDSQSLAYVRQHHPAPQLIVRRFYFVSPSKLRRHDPSCNSLLLCPYPLRYFSPHGSRFYSTPNSPPKPPEQGPLLPLLISFGVLSLMGLYLISVNWLEKFLPAREIDFQTFKSELLDTTRVTQLVVRTDNKVLVYLDNNKEPSYFFSISNVENFEKKLEKAQRKLGIDPFDYVVVKYAKESPWTGVFFSVLPLLIFFGIVGYMLNRPSLISGGRPGGSRDIFGITKHKAKLFDKTMKVGVSFKDVAGMDAAKQEIMEFVSFLKNPTKYSRLGAKIPKGALLVGPPGTGKTLLAKATAGEASVPFFSIAGSDFVEMFVGVGPGRVRDLFAEARANSPCIIFIDEIDAVGRTRSRIGYNDERENTLNQLLVELDGFNPSTGIVVLAGTNRPDILDNALLRPGRFDRRIAINLPDIKERKEIFEVHLKPLKLAEDIENYSKKLAALTPGFSGADISNVCNEAALIAARTKKTAVEMVDFDKAIDRVVAGVEKKSKILSLEERTKVAYHECGHAVVSWFLEHCDPLLKISIVPHSSSLGYAMYQPQDQYIVTKEQLLDQMCKMLGGRVAEQVFFSEVTTGAADDLQKLTQRAYSQVKIYGMSEAVGTVSFPPPQDEVPTEKPYSEATAKLIDSEALALINQALKRTEQLVREKKHLIERLAKQLLIKEVLQVEEIESILGKRPYRSRASFDELTNQAPLH